MTFQALFQEYLNVYFGLDEGDTAMWRLIGRYREKVSPRLLAIEQELLAKAKVQAKEFFKEATETPPWWKDLIPKDDTWRGCYYPVPIWVKDAK